MTVSLLFSGFDHLSVQQAQKRYPPSKSCYGIPWERGHTHSNLYACVVSVMCLWWDCYRAKKLAWQSSSSLTAYKSVICNTLGNSTKHYYRYRQEVIVRLSKPWGSCTDHTCWGFSSSRSAHTLINLGLLLISGKAHQLVVLSGLSYSYLMLNGICTYAILFCFRQSFCYFTFYPHFGKFVHLNFFAMHVPDCHALDGHSLCLLVLLHFNMTLLHKIKSLIGPFPNGDISHWPAFCWQLTHHWQAGMHCNRFQHRDMSLQFA